VFECVEVEAKAFLFNFDNSLAIKDKDKILSRQEQKPFAKTLHLGFLKIFDLLSYCIALHLSYRIRQVWKNTDFLS
jgi:hypothetical protein